MKNIIYIIQMYSNPKIISYSIGVLTYQLKSLDRSVQSTLTFVTILLKVTLFYSSINVIVV